jgi:tRNA A37 threonylcarbamoyladenosine synthetase subunit TsaC/SUA5/YrdC
MRTAEQHEAGVGGADVAESRLVVDRIADCARAAERLAAGAVVAHAFANFYAITTRGDEVTVRRVNELKGRPAEQVGSITAPPAALAEAWDFDQLPSGLTRRRVLDVVNALLELGPFGFRGPAAAYLPRLLTSVDAGVTTTQVIAPGTRCPSNVFLEHALEATGDRFLYVTSANHSRHLTGADDTPAHWRAEGLGQDFAGTPGFVLLEHDDEARARLRYPRHLPMSTSILSFHTVGYLPGDRRPHLTLERHGSLAAADVRAVLADLGFGLHVGRGAVRRLQPRSYEVG